MSSIFEGVSFRKTHKYETQQALSEMAPDQIVMINPEDIGFYIESRPAVPPLNQWQQKALDTVLRLKRDEKKSPSLKQHMKDITRERKRNSFLLEYGSALAANPEISSLMFETRQQIAKEQAEKAKFQEDLTKLKDGVSKLGGGKRKKTKNHRKRKNQTKSKKHRKSKKKSLHKSKR
jgi:hypothetical protein